MDEPRSIFNKDGGHYNIFKGVTMDTLKTVFPDGEANELNFVLFSTSGVHGTYKTIEEIENILINGATKDDYSTDLTVLVVHPRLVTMMYGEITVSLEDIQYLKKLRESSKKAIMEIGESGCPLAIADKTLKAENEKLKAECAELKAALLLSVEEKCAKYHIQDCYNCLNRNCGDNINPLIKEKI